METKLKQEPVADGGELEPEFDWKRMEEVAADELCTPKEHEAYGACVACMAIRGTRWALQMRSELASSQEALRLAGEQSYALGFNECREQCKQIVDEHDGYLTRISLLSPEGSSQRHCDYKNCSLPHGHIQSCNELDSKPEGSSR